MEWRAQGAGMTNSVVSIANPFDTAGTDPEQVLLAVRALALGNPATITILSWGYIPSRRAPMASHVIRDGEVRSFIRVLNRRDI